MLTKSGFSWDDNRKMIQCEKQQNDDHCRKNNEAKGLYGVAFPHYDTLAAIYGKHIATGEGAEGLGEAVANMEKEIVQDIQDEEDEEDEERVSREMPRRSIDSAAARRSIDSATPRQSIDSTASSSKKRKKDSNKLKNTLSSDPFMDVFANVQGDLRDVTKHVGAMVASMQREAEIQEKAMAEEDPLQKIQNEAILECQKLGLTGTEVVNAAAAFVKVPAQMSMLLALPESLRREYVLKILAGNSLDQSCSVANATGNISLYFVIINSTYIRYFRAHAYRIAKCSIISPFCSWLIGYFTIVEFSPIHLSGRAREGRRRRSAVVGSSVAGVARSDDGDTRGWRHPPQARLPSPRSQIRPKGEGEGGGGGSGSPPSQIQPEGGGGRWKRRHPPPTAAAPLQQPTLTLDPVGDDPSHSSMD
uniref:OJ1005_B10.23 protein n=1 Tax=Oryza sativa subsp. japonica TaxID=39947 RepID=Q7EZN3_ORYSJ|nr:OJ1005_B10.23 [Oryza sativa Japonica Group]